MSSVTSVFVVFVNVFSAVALILTNKRIVVVDEFNYMTLLTGLHFYFSFLFCSLLLLLGIFQYKAVSNYYTLMKICLGSLASVVFMNLNLATNSVGFYQLSKLSCIPITLIIETILNRRQQILNVTMMFSLLCILGGMSFIVIHELSLNFLGLVWASIAVLCTSLAQVLFSPFQKELGMNSMQLLYHTSPILTIGSYLLVPFFEDTHRLLNTTITGSLVFHIVASCLFAVFLNLSNYFVLSMVSPLTYQILNHCKTILVILSGVIFFGELPSSKVITGMIVVIVGVIIYTEENRQQQIRKADQILSTQPTQGGLDSLECGEANDSPTATLIKEQPTSSNPQSSSPSSGSRTKLSFQSSSTDTYKLLVSKQ